MRNSLSKAVYSTMDQKRWNNAVCIRGLGAVSTLVSYLLCGIRSCALKIISRAKDKTTSAQGMEDGGRALGTLVRCFLS